MAPRLRHFAICVGDLDRSAAFYEKVFGFKKVGQETVSIGTAYYLSDGVINLALLNFSGDTGSGVENAASFLGANHFGVQVDDLKETQRLIEEAGGEFFFDLGDERKGNFERKFKDPDGIVFDISHHGWLGTDSRVDPPGE
ncbi:VOC family protein [Amorphus orientalis]|uniref:Catechol 2,3-dioxygenase-like lactoylglutathione lyase family enzyme n=1 Tax=Amorphus orientalis TaxID=649198 RepID=A0AAE3VQT5_9HYPH|nr:VOC family protein [Amorphus orientalis]MDQ0316490.1 catechol 2,3-dioxygenase-like lactoylglutathione lyase family enzyme [Amorphus orientalis]